jgi:hypothetical protein
MNLKFFEVDPARNSRLCDVEFYQMPLDRLVADTLKTDRDFQEVCEDLLPSWSKTVEYPAKAKGFFVSMIKQIILGQGNFPELNFALQAESPLSYKGSPRVVMMFLPGSCRVADGTFEQFGEFAREAVGSGFDVVAVAGDTTTNREAEQFVKQAVRAAKDNKRNLLILSRGMAQRSFSIPEISELYLCFDSGEVGTTIQKLSRVLTPNFDHSSKIGRVISLSFDPNRNDLFHAMVLETAAKVAKRENISASDALKSVLHTIDIFNCTADGRVQFNYDEYLREIVARKTIDRVIGKVFDMTVLNDIDIIRLAAGEKAFSKLPKVDVTPKGKTRNASPTQGVRLAGQKPLSLKQIEEARKALVALVENLDVIMYGSRCKNLKDAFKVLDASEVRQKGIEMAFNMDYDFVRHLFTCGAINEQLISLRFDR